MCLFAVVLLIWLDNSLANRRRLSGSVSDEQIGNHDRESYHGKTFVVTNVSDGDTIDVKAPDGRSECIRIRLLGIDTPEADRGESGRMHFASQAVEFTKQSALGKSVTAYADITGATRGKYGRLLAYIKLPDGRFLNEVLLVEGYAYADLRFSHSLFNKYVQLSDTARHRKKGLWQAVKREQLPEWLRSRRPDLLQSK